MKKILSIICIISLMLMVGATCKRKTTNNLPISKPEVKKVAEEEIITSYAECIVAGNRMIQSTPRQCKSADGKVYTEIIDVPMPTDTPPEPPALPDTELPKE